MDDLKAIEEEANKKVDFQKILKKAGITEETINNAKNLKRAKEFKRELPKFKKALKKFKEELRRYKETGKGVHREEAKNGLKEAKLLEITLNGRKVKKRFLKDRMENLKEEEDQLEKEAKELNIPFKKELDGVSFE
ncbi:MAG: hypothetical protein U9N35_07815 [Euryarchaeota archaeon]|nr:hypothetical protein [Euryarchaeota archaeon]